MIEYKIESNKVIAIDSNNGQCIGEIDFPFIDAQQNSVNMNHTFVDPNYRGQQIADQLFQKAIETIKQRQLKVRPTCSYVIKQFERHQELNALVV